MVSFGLSLPGNNTIATSQQELRYRGLGCPVLDAFQGRVLSLYHHAYWIDAPLRTIPSPLHPFQLLPPLARRKSIRRIDSQQTVFPCCVKRETAPRPVLRMGDQFSLDRVQVHVVQQERPALEKRQGRGTLKFQIKAGPPVQPKGCGTRKTFSLGKGGPPAKRAEKDSQERITVFSMITRTAGYRTREAR